MTNTPKQNQDIVLIVEDTAANHEVIQSFLKDIDVQCESAFDGMEAITMCNAAGDSYYSLILMDIQLPHMDGFEVSARLHKMGVCAPIIAITASSKDDDRLKDARDLFDDLLFKPFNSSEFFAAISPYIKNAVFYSPKPKPCDPEKTDLPLIDRTICDVPMAIANMGNSLRLFRKHFNNFKKNNADLMLRMQAMINHGEFKTCADLCHSIKGLSGMLGLTSLYGHVVELETLLRKQSSPKETIYDLLASIDDDIRLVCQIQF